MSMTSASSLSTANFVTTATTLVPTSISVSSLNSTSSSNSQPTLPPGQSPDGKSSNDGNDHDRDDYVFNYYFLFLIMFGVLLMVLFWWLHQQRKRRKERMQLGGQNALARDLEGWTSPRRFMHGRYGRNNHAAMARREEGLNEQGEAPPPYEPKFEGTTVHHTYDGTEDSSGGVTVPLRTFSGHELGRTTPPTYNNSIQPDTPEITRSRPL